MRELAGLSENFGIIMSNFLTHALRDAQTYSQLSDIKSMDQDRQRRLITELHSCGSSYEQLAIADTSGRLLAAAVTPADPIDSIAAVPSFQIAATEGRQAWWIGPTLDGDRQILHIHTPIKGADDEVIGVLGSPVTLQELSGILGSFQMSGSGEAFVLDESGRLLLHTDPDEVTNQRDYGGVIGVTDEGLPDQMGTARYPFDGVTRIAAYYQNADLGWTIVVDRPESELLALSLAARNLAASMVFFSVFISLLAAILLARGLTRPVREIAVAAEALGAGDSDAPLPEPISSDELGTLVTTFGAMRESINERESTLLKAYDELEVRVEE